MRMLMAIAFGCALMIGVNHAANSGPTTLGGQPALGATSAEGFGLDDASQFRCPISPICQQASQCTAYCAGGIPVCFQGCCSCAS